MTKEQLEAGVQINTEIEELETFIRNFSRCDLQAVESGRSLNIPDRHYDEYEAAMDKYQKDFINVLAAKVKLLQSEFDKL